MMMTDYRQEPPSPMDIIDPCAAPRIQIVSKTTDLTALEHAGGTSNKLLESEVIAPQTMNNMIVTTIESKKDKSFVCDVCNVTCNSEDMFKKHKDGKKHLKNIKKLLFSSAIMQKTLTSVANHDILDQMSEKMKQDLVTELPKERNSIRCELCGISCTSQYQFDKHISGRKHKNKAMKSESLPVPTAKRSLQDSMMEEGQDVFTERSKRKVDNVSPVSDESANTKRQEMIKEDVGSGNLLINVDCEDGMAFNTHIVSLDHSAMALEHAGGG